MIYPSLKRRDQALACTSVMFRRPYKLETSLDLGVFVLVARCDASLEKAWTASQREGMGLAEKSQKGQKQQDCHRANLKLRFQCAGAHVPVHCQLLPWR